MTRNKDVVLNRVFIGCPWKIIRPKYLKIVKKLEHKFPIHFVLIGREQNQRAEELLGLIKKNLLSSTVAIFDVTAGNPNVSPGPCDHTSRGGAGGCAERRSGRSTGNCRTSRKG